MLQEAFYEWTYLSHWLDRGYHGDLVLPWIALSKQGERIVATSTRTAPVGTDTAFDFQWSAIFAGAVAASAVAFILHAFAAAIGISLSSTAPTWRDASFALVLLSGLYLIGLIVVIMAILSFLGLR
jgi:hypothetical protein